MENQNQYDSVEQDSASKHSGQVKRRSDRDMPTSARGNKDGEGLNQEELKSEAQLPKNDISEDAESRVLNEEENNMEPQIGQDGEFKRQAGWTRKEGLSEEERRTSEEEDLNGRHSDDASAL